MKRIKLWNKYGKWTIVWRPEKYVYCECDCWTVTQVKLNALLCGQTKSCWCYKLEKMTTHGMSKTRFYRIWNWIKGRCNWPNKNYWWRWITYAEKWETFEWFYEDMYEDYIKHEKIYWTKNTTIERNNNDWHYTKQNCEWATRQVQVKNKRK